MKRLILLIFLFTSLLPSCFAEKYVLHFKDGRIIEGDIVKQDDQQVTISIDTGKALSYYKFLITKIEPSIEYHQGLGDELYKTEKYDEAMKEFEKVLQSDPKQKYALSQISTINTIIKSEKLKRQTKENENTAALLFSQGMTYFHDSNFELAKEKFQETLKYTPDNEQAKKYLDLSTQKVQTNVAQSIQNEQEQVKVDKVLKQEQLETLRKNQSVIVTNQPSTRYLNGAITFTPYNYNRYKLNRNADSVLEPGYDYGTTDYSYGVPNEKNYTFGKENRDSSIFNTTQESSTQSLYANNTESPFLFAENKNDISKNTSPNQSVSSYEQKIDSDSAPSAEQPSLSINNDNSNNYLIPIIICGIPIIFLGWYFRVGTYILKIVKVLNKPIFQTNKGNYNQQAKPSEKEDIFPKLVQLFICVATSDGVMSKIEEQTIINIINASPFYLDEINTMKVIFYKFQQESFRTEPIPAICSMLFKNLNKTFKIELINALFIIALCDNGFDQSEENCIKSINSNLGLEDSIYYKIKEQFQNRTRQENYSSKEDIKRGSKLDEQYYKVLGVKSGSSFKEIKHAFKILAKMYHPDTVQHHGSEYVKIATEKFKEINEAYQYFEKIFANKKA
jgi:DnaJ-domain-containing protein 1